MKEQLMKHIQFVEKNTISFSQLAFAYMKRCNCQYEKDFCNKTHLSEGTYKRIKKGEMTYIPKFETVMSICYGLNLGALDGMRLLKSAGFDLAGSTIRLHHVHHYVLSNISANGIDAYDEILGTFGYSIIKKNVKCTN